VLKLIIALLPFFAFCCGVENLSACSTYKVTVGDKTMVGSNYDTWLETPRIWFETNGYGTAFTGARADGEFGFAPQTGMNEFGLAFVTLATATPEKKRDLSDKKRITSRTNYLKDILHTCKTVDEVKTFIEQYDHSTLSNDVFFYVDKTGKYLVVEPYELTLGNDPKYVLANFCPSTITDFESIKQVRYRNGSAFLENKIDTSLAFCTALSDTMHVCRTKHGDGTLLTSILDLSAGVTYLNFYHDYTKQVKFDLREELAKGDHFLEIPALFPANAEFQKLKEYKTPLNSDGINLFLQLCLLLFVFSALLFSVSYLLNKKKTPYSGFKLLLIALSIAMAYYIFLLATEMNIYYFPAPYSDGTLSLVSVASYIPFLLLVLIIPILNINRKILKNSTWTFFPKWIFTLNSITYLVLIVLFTYWGLYSVLA
jgi:hypothetical protein